MKATVLVDNIGNDGMEGEWGLSIFIEYGEKKILLDTGASNLFLKNAGKMGVDIRGVDYGVISHAHYDHSDGLADFFKNNSRAKCFFREGTEENCYCKKGIFRKYIGVPRKVLKEYDDRIQYVEGDFQLCEGAYLIPHKTEGLDTIGKREKMFVKKEGKWYPDDFSHEQSLVLETQKGLIIFNSCSHGGAYNIINEVAETFPDKNVYGLIGGFHLYNKKDEEIRTFAEQIKNTGIQYVCTGHCTGKRAYNILKEELGDVMHQLRVNLKLEL